VVAALCDASQLKVNEWMANPASGDDWFEIYNPNPQPVALAGLWLSDDLVNRLKQEIPPLSFMASGLYGFQRFWADGHPELGANHVSFQLKASGEAVALSAASGALIDGLAFGAQAVGVSQGRLPDGGATVVSFPGTDTPGDSNYLPIQGVILNEVLSHASAPLEQAIELQNTNAAPANIGGWYLSNAKHTLKRYRIPNNTIIPANGYIVFYEYQFNALGDPNRFSLNAALGDQVYLSVADGNGNLTGYRAVMSFGPAENATSFGRYVTTVGEPHFVAMSTRTFGVDNPDTVQQFRTGTGLPNAYPKVGPIVISEIMYHPPDVGGLDDTLDEFIELHNITASTQPLYHPTFPSNTWELKNAVSFTFPTNLSIAPNDFLLVVSFDPADAAQLSAFRTK